MTQPIVEPIGAVQAPDPRARRRPAPRFSAGPLLALFRRAGDGLADWVVAGVAVQAGAEPRARRMTRLPGDPEVSVIVPCRNGALTLGKALRSLRRQGVREWEAIVVDDGSTDATPEVIRACAATDPRIRSLRTEGLGVAEARNAGLAVARGDWILFLDCDDWLEPSALARLLSAAARSPAAGVVAGAAVKVRPDGRRQRLPRLDLADPFTALCCEGRIAIHSAIARAQLVRKAGGFDPSLRTSEDWDLWQRLARMGVGFVQIPQVVACYRNTPGSLSKDPLQVARDGLAVLRRGHGPDPRAPAAPAHAAGAPADALRPRACYFVLWCAARDIALGGDGVALAELLPEDACDAEPASLGALMASGMADVLALPERALGPQWEQFEPKLRRLLALFGPERARLQRLTLAVIKARFAGAGGDPGELDLARKSPAPADTPEVVQLCWKGRPLGAVAAPALAPRGSASLAETIAAQVPRLPLRDALLGGGLAASPRFWSVALAGFVRRRPPETLLELDQLKPALRQALGEALAEVVRARLLRAPRRPDAHQQAVGRIARAADAEALSLSAQLDGGPPPPAAARCRPLPRLGAGAVRVPVLMYHRVAHDPAPGLERYCLSPQRFEQQLRTLRAEGCTPVTPAEVLRFLRFEADLPARPVMLTFDDGYLDFFQHAWPSLRRYAVPAVVYAVTGRVGGCADWDAGTAAPAPLMDWRQLRLLAQNGVAVESHGHTHRPLPRLATHELYEEALRSRAMLKAMLGQAPVSFCYPYGAHGPVAERVVEECGYRLAFTSREAPCDRSAEPLRAPRIEVSGLDDPETFARKLRLSRGD